MPFPVIYIEIVSQVEGEWVLDNEFNIVQNLVKTLPQKYCVQLRLVAPCCDAVIISMPFSIIIRNEFIRKTLSDAKLDRFGVKDLEEIKVL
jgi:hypothetical protein